MKPRPPLKAPPPEAASGRYLRLCLFASGACAFVIAAVGARLIAPFDGASVDAWSALIATALLALAFGCAWGGRLADRSPFLVLFSKLLIAAGLTVAAIPILSERVLGATAPFGGKIGAAVAAAILVGPALVLLGTLCPVAARLTATGAADVGRRAGDSWAAFGAGGAFGAALLDLVLAPFWPPARILLACAAALIALGAWGTWLSTRKLPLGQLATCAACLVFAAAPLCEGAFR